VFLWKICKNAWIVVFAVEIFTHFYLSMTDQRHLVYMINHNMSHFDVTSEGHISKFFMNTWREWANGIHGNLLEVWDYKLLNIVYRANNVHTNARLSIQFFSRSAWASDCLVLGCLTYNTQEIPMNIRALTNSATLTTRINNHRRPLIVTFIIWPT
jgi:hypothetical protein